MKNLFKNWSCIAEEIENEVQIENNFLTQDEAEFRSSLISDVAYQLILALPKGEFYIGNWIVNFNFNDDPKLCEEIFLDFETFKCLKITINFHEINEESIKNERLYIPYQNLQRGSNRVEISYISKYKKTGVGLHKFIDPIDHEEYVYSQFAVFHAHKAFPCFDQPDLKAKMMLVLVTPENHSVWSNSLEKYEKYSEYDKEFCESLFGEYNIKDQVNERFEEPYKVTMFNSELVMSTYLFAIISGPYDINERFETIDKNKDPIRMRVMCRKSTNIKIKNHFF